MLMADEDEKTAFLSRAALVDRLYKPILPDTRANEFSRVRAVVKFLADGIAAYGERPDVSSVMARVEQLAYECSRLARGMACKALRAPAAEKFRLRTRKGHVNAYIWWASGPETDRNDGTHGRAMP